MELFALISIARGEDAEAFDITIDMFDVDSALGNSGIGFPFLRRQFMVL